MNPLNWLDGALEEIDRLDLRRAPLVRSARPDGATLISQGKLLVNFGSNDYLGLAPVVGRRVVEVLEQTGWGSGASPLVTGKTASHETLERELAAWKRTEAAILFSSGFAANAGTIPALVSRGDLIYSDAKNHASIIDGCRLSGAEVVIYQHGDARDLAGRLAGQGRGVANNAGRRLIVTDSVFSMDGDLAPLGEIAELAEKHGAMLMVDEAHAAGVFGERGSGLCEALGVEERVHVRVGTLSKALGGIGGFVAGSQKLIDWLLHRARSQLFSTALPEACALASLEALRYVHEEPNRRQGLLATSKEVRARLKSMGRDVGNSESQIIPVRCGAPARALELSRRLREAGYFVPAIRPPSVPDGESLLRISLTAAHCSEQIQGVCQCLVDVK
jgi:8-amino-7-oxononanoate synthase